VLNVAKMGKTRNPYRISVRIPLEKVHLEYREGDGRITLRHISWKSGLNTEEDEPGSESRLFLVSLNFGFCYTESYLVLYKRFNMCEKKIVIFGSVSFSPSY
jgi:hypothetical protein